jgi:hypothetical protein
MSFPTYIALLPRRLQASPLHIYSAGSKLMAAPTNLNNPATQPPGLGLILSPHFGQAFDFELMLLPRSLHFTKTIEHSR